MYLAFSLVSIHYFPPLVFLCLFPPWILLASRQLQKGVYFSLTTSVNFPVLPQIYAYLEFTMRYGQV